MLFHALMHLFKLLFLRVIQNCFDLALRVTLNGFGFGTLVRARYGLVLKELLHLLIPAYQNRLDLRLLVGCQVKLLRHMRGLLIRIGSLVITASSRSWLTLSGLRLRCSAVLRKPCAARYTNGEKSRECKGKEFILHGCCFLQHFLETQSMWECCADFHV